MADIEIKNLVKIYGYVKPKWLRKWNDNQVPEGKRAVDNISIRIPSGSFTVFVGPSGCGKTTLLRMIAGLEEITSGQIKIGDVDITNLEPGDRGIAMAFQNYALYPHMTVRENIEFGLINARIPRFEIKERTDMALKMVDLSEFQNRHPANLSGGQRQRVALARAISKMPQIFLMDEPLSNLDAKLRSEMRTELIHLHRKLKSTFIYVTHDQIEAMTMGDNIVVMNEGKIMQHGTPTEIHNNPSCVFVARFVGDPGMNIVTVNEKYSIGFRPRDVIFDCNEESDDKIVIRGRIMSFENHGSEYLYQVEFNGKTVFVKELSKNQRAIGSDIVFALLKENVYVFDKNELRVRDERVIEEAYGEFKKSWRNL